MVKYILNRITITHTVPQGFTKYSKKICIDLFSINKLITEDSTQIYNYRMLTETCKVSSTL